jgi:hypothetical protein
LKGDKVLLAAMQKFESVFAKFDQESDALHEARKKGREAFDAQLDRAARREGIANPEIIVRLQEAWDIDRAKEEEKRERAREKDAGKQSNVPLQRGMAVAHTEPAQLTGMPSIPLLSTGIRGIV